MDLAIHLSGQRLFSATVANPSDRRELVCDLDAHLPIFDRDHVSSVTGLPDFWEAMAAFLADQQYFAIGPSFAFDPRHYTSQCVPFQGLHPLLHYIVAGDAAGIDPHPMISSSWVRQRYAVDAKTTTLGFMLRDPCSIAPSPYFDPVFYQEVNLDVYRAAVAPLAHYLEYGREEGRNFHRLFNVGWYCKLSGRERCGFDTFRDNRQWDGLFPNPKARAEWVELSDWQVRDLFDYHLTRTSYDRYPFRIDEALELMPDLSQDEQRSIKPAFTQRSSKALQRELLDWYASRADMGDILVSVVIPTRNRLPTLQNAMRSVQNQSHHNVEILVVDDGGADGTDAWVAGLDDPRIRYWHIPASGVSAARNRGLEAARGKYIAFLDSDNALLLDFLAAMLALCERDGVDFAYGALRLFNHKGDVRFRFREYRRDDYWRTNYIDLNVVFHSRERFAGLRFDKSLRRCVDWDYLLRAAERLAPVGVPVVGCDYCHEGSNVDRITLDGPIWDCFRVCRSHRPAPVRSERTANVIVLPITSDSATNEIRRLSRDLMRLPAGWRVQAAYNLEVSAEERLALRSLLVSRGHPEPLQSTAPLCAGALRELGMAACPLDADRWHIVDPSWDLSLARVVSMAEASPEVTAVTIAGTDGLIEAIYHDPDTRRWEYAEVDGESIGDNCLPLRATLLNLPASAGTLFELRYSGSMILPLLIGSLFRIGPVRSLVESGSAGKSLKMPEVFAGLDLVNEASALPPSVGTPGRSAIVSEVNILDGTLLRTGRRRKRLSMRKPLAVFTPAPHAGSGWGDEHYAISLAEAMRQERVPCEVVYRGDWASKRDAYDAIIHLRGIVPATLSWTARNFLWIISHPDAISDVEYGECESIGVASRPFADHLRKVLARNVHYLPQCTAFRPPAPSAQEGPLSEYALFVGDSKGVHRHPINELVRHWERLFLIGPRWGDLPNMGPRYLPRSLDNGLLPQLYASFGATLNQHWESMARLGFVSNRVYDVIASGGRLITDHCEDIPADLRDRIVVWRGGSVEEAFSQARDLGRSWTIDAAHAFAEENSYRRRARSLLEYWRKDVGDLGV